MTATPSKAVGLELSRFLAETLPPSRARFAQESSLTHTCCLRFSPPPSRFVQYMPQLHFRGRQEGGTNERPNNFAPGDTIEFKDPLNAEFYFASITSFNLMIDGPGDGPRAEACPLTTAVRKTDGCLATCLSPCISKC